MLIIRDGVERCDILPTMGLPLEKRRYTIAEYLAMEEMSQVKHEFHNGEILAMSGGSVEHGLISGNIFFALKKRLDDTPCQPLNDQIRVRIRTESRYVYPDVSIVCGELDRDPDDQKCSITNPRVLIEVLSESTESYDRDEKFSLYRKVASLEEYVLISQSRAQVESYLRQSDEWGKFTFTSGIESILTIASLGLQIPIAEIYKGVQLRESDHLQKPHPPADA